jgi:regulatory protein
MTRTGRAPGSGEAEASAAADRGAEDPEARALDGPDADGPDADGPDAEGRPAEGRDPESRARQICLRLLTIAPRTRAQLAQAMHRGGVPDEAAEAVLNRFTDAGLIDDAAFARAWVESRHHSRGLSKRSLSAELRRHGVQNDEIREAVDALDPEQEVGTARRLVERKLASNRGRPAEARARQAAGMLARKGYPPGLAFRLIREIMQQEGAELDEMDPDAYIDPDAEDPGA